MSFSTAYENSFIFGDTTTRNFGSAGYDVTPTTIYYRNLTSFATPPQHSLTFPVGEPEVIIQFVAILSLSVVSFVGNFLLMMTILRSKQLRSSVGNALIFNLGLVDTAVAIFILPVFAATTATRTPPGVSSWHGETEVASCSVIGCVTQTLNVASVSTLSLIAVERYLSICQPMQYSQWVTGRSMAIVIGVSWVYSMLVASIPLAGYGRYVFHGKDQIPICSADYTETERGYAALVLGLVVGPAIVIIAFSYTRLFQVARSQMRKIQDANAAHGNNKATKASPTAAPPINTQQQKQAGAANEASCSSSQPKKLPPNFTVVMETNQRQTVAGGDLAPTQNSNGKKFALSTSPSVSKTVSFDAKSSTAGTTASRNEIALNDVIRLRAKVLADVAKVRPAARWVTALTGVKKAVKHLRAARTVALIIGCFVVCWTPYTAVTIVTIATGSQPTQPAINFFATFMTFASGMVEPIVCLLVNRDFNASFRRIVGLRRRELLRLAAEAFAEASAGTEPEQWGQEGPGGGPRERYSSIGSDTSSADSMGDDWIVFKERWNELQAAALERAAAARSTMASSPIPTAGSSRDKRLLTAGLAGRKLSDTMSAMWRSWQNLQSFSH